MDSIRIVRPAVLPSCFMILLAVTTAAHASVMYSSPETMICSLPATRLACVLAELPTPISR